jgi:hypothetical protein
VVNSSASVQGDILTISGNIRNDGTTEASDVELVATLFDAANQVVNAGTSAPDTLPPGATRPFLVVFSWHWEDYDRYELQVQGF